MNNKCPITPGKYVISINEMDAKMLSMQGSIVSGPDDLTPLDYHPPLTSEIIAWLGADKERRVEIWDSINGWRKEQGTLTGWKFQLDRRGDEPQYGYRIPNVPQVRAEVQAVIDLAGEITGEEVGALLDALHEAHHPHEETKAQ